MMCGKFKKKLQIYLPSACADPLYWLWSKKSEYIRIVEMHF